MPRERVIGPPSDGRSTRDCLVNGCPLPGVWTSSTTGGPRICFVHDGLKPSRWAEATTEIRASWQLDDAAFRTFGLELRARLRDEQGPVRPRGDVASSGLQLIGELLP